jgi:lipoprotein NlpD
MILQHSDGFISIYKHCSALLKNERDIVVQGELIGLSGNSGKNTTGPHLHFEIWKDGKPENPKEFFIK